MRARPCVVCETPIPLTRTDRLACSSKGRKRIERAYRTACDPKVSPSAGRAATALCNRIIQERLIREAIAIGVMADPD